MSSTLSRTPPIFRTTAGGAEEAAASELEELGAHSLKQGHLGYYCKADSEILYRRVYMTRISTRILAPLIHFNCHSTNYLYKTAQQINWTDFLTLTKTFAITANTADSQLRNSNYAAQVLKDAIVDQFRDALENDRMSTHDSRSTTKSLRSQKSRPHQRRSRGWISSQTRVSHRTCSRSHARKRRCDYSSPKRVGRQPTLFDPFCGSGTLLMEAL